MDKFSFLGNSEINSVEELYKQYLSDPGSVDESWADFFKGFGDPSKKQYSRRVILGIHGGLPDK